MLMCDEDAILGEDKFRYFEEYVGEYDEKSIESLSSRFSHFKGSPIVSTEYVKQKSSSENVSTAFSSFRSSSILKSTFPQHSWPSIMNESLNYIQSSDASFESSFNSDFQRPHNVFNQKFESKNGKQLKDDIQTDLKKKICTRLSLNPPKKHVKMRNYVKFPFLHEILEVVLCSMPSFNIHFFEELKISINKHIILDEKDLTNTSQISLPETGFAGIFTLNVKDINDGILSEGFTYFKEENLTMGVQIVSKFTNGFQLIEEKKTEFQQSDTELKEKSLYIFAENENYIAYQTTTINDVKQKYRGCVNVNSEIDFVQDGNLFALMRYLVAVNYSGCFQCYSMAISGRMCTQRFFINKTRRMRFNEYLVEAIRIKKCTFDFLTKKKLDISQTYFLKTGAMIQHTWRQSPYILHIDPALISHQSKLNPCLECTWTSDYIFSLIFKFRKKYTYIILTKYLNSYPEFMELFNDFIICLLNVKPKSVIKFSCNFFEHA